MKKTIVAIMAHSDDIEYSAGGTLARYIDQGYRGLYGVLSQCNSGWTVTEEEGGHYISSQEIIPRRRAEAEAAARVFGAELYYGPLLENCYTTRDGRRIVPSFLGPEGVEGDRIAEGVIPADDLPRGSLFLTAAGAGGTWEGHQVVREVADLLVQWEPELVIGQPFGNMNPDHFLAAQIVAIAWQLAAKKADMGPYWLPVMSRPDDEYLFPPQKPDRFVDVSGFEETCLKAAACHVSQGAHLPGFESRRRRYWKNWTDSSGFDSTEAFIEVYTRGD